MKVAIAGASGLLGSNWCAALRNTWNIIPLWHTRMFEYPWLAGVSISLSSMDELCHFMESSAPDLVVNCAALTNIERCEREPELAELVNAQIAGNIAAACDKYGVKLIHISTDHLFRGDKSFYAENESVCPVNSYGRTKALGEKLVLDKHSSALVVRTNFFGNGLDGSVSFSDKIISALQEDREMLLFDDVFYTPIAMSELILKVMQLVNLDVSGIFNVCGTERLSKYEFGLLVASAGGFNLNLLKPTSINDRTDLVRRPRDLSLATDKLTKVVAPPLSLDRQISSLW